MEIPPSPLSPKYRFQLDSIYENFVGNLAVISETRGEASFEWGSVRRPFEGEKIRYRELDHAWLRCRLWLSLVRLSMFRHLFIDLLEYGGFGC
ncbi:hypothetical protein H5410_031804 [Solanum commersonii]|uniref:Uncharacterized protein n=1 Tax=Solanum commersonii TaxID=4109 RepID=A0A9J5YJA2_SOLCO|nr:hypothetical protein H5410_031804 [Solanum commersonii]